MSGSGPSASPKHTTLTLEIHELAGGGDGVGRADGRAVFVADVAPGDRVRVRVPTGRRRWARGELLEIVSPGPARQASTCALSERCGGCQWHQVRYADQVAAKRSILARALRQARVILPPEGVGPVHEAPAPLAYRRRARLHLSTDEAGARVLGFRMRRSHQVIDVGRCPVVAPPLAAVIEAVRGELHRLPQEGELRLLADPHGEVALELSAPAPSPGLAARLGRALAGRSPLVGMVCRSPEEPDREADVWGRVTLDLATSGELPLRADPGEFSQANQAADRLMRERVRALAGRPRGPVLELYAGAGNLTRELALLAAVVAVERDHRLADRARGSLGDLGVRIVRAEAALATRELAAEGFEPELVVLDPPRAGAADVIPVLRELTPPRVLYVSCDPMTLARDLATLTAGGRYRLASVEGIDTMPQTFHFETLALCAA